MDDYEETFADVQRCVAQKKWFPRRAKHVRELVSDLLSRRGYAQQQATVAWHEAWFAAVDERAAKHTRPGKLRRGVWEIYVRNSPVMQELTFDKSRILQQLQRALPDHDIQDLRFRVGPIS